MESKKVKDIIHFHLSVLEMPKTKQNIDMATTMFIEGCRYVIEKERQGQKKLLKGFGYKKNEKAKATI